MAPKQANNDKKIIGLQFIFPAGVMKSEFYFHCAIKEQVHDYSNNNKRVCVSEVRENN